MLVVGVERGKRRNEFFDGLMFVAGMNFDQMILMIARIVEGEAMCRKN